MTDTDRDRRDAAANEGADTRGDTDRDGDTGWPVRFQGITESVVTTLGPNDRWNCAALGLHAGDGADIRRTDATVTARTWGRTRTWRNFRERGTGYVQFVHDPLVFTEAALTIREESAPILDAAAAWVRVAVEKIDAGQSDGTPWVEWALSPQEAAIEARVVPTINRGHGAVIEATVAASRLDVDEYDTDELLDRLSHLEGVVERCGGPRERAAFSRLVDVVGQRW